MEYGKIIAVTGLPGLFELLSSKNDGAIVRSLEDKTTKFVSSRVHNFSHLESIEVFTVRDNVNLTDIFHAMEKEDDKAPDGKDAGALKKYFEKVFPDLDFEKVYSSDLKKMVKWFDVLKKNEVEIKLSQPEPEEQLAAEEEIPAEEQKPETGKKKTKSEASAETVAANPDAETPKKAAAKKKPATGKTTTEDEEQPKVAKKAAKKAAPGKK